MPRDPTLYLAPCVNEDAQEHFRRTVLSTIPRDTYVQHTQRDYGDEFYMWGVRDGNVRYWQQIERGDILLFYTESGLYTHAARVRDTQHKPDLGDEVYTEADDPFSHLIYLEEPFEVDIPSAQLHDLIGYGRDFPINFTIVGDDRLAAIRTQYGSVRAYVRQQRLHGPDAPEDEVEEAASDLDTETSREPSLTESSEQYTTQQRRARSAAFRREVTRLYDDTCVVCGDRRESPSGMSDVQAAHIYPRSENGSDDIRNGITLCLVHHWAMDNGWLAIDNNYELMVRDAPEIDSYDEFIQYDGQAIALPEKHQHWPHPKFLEAHRELHGFAHSR